METGIGVCSCCGEAMVRVTLIDAATFLCDECYEEYLEENGED